MNMNYKTFNNTYKHVTHHDLIDVVVYIMIITIIASLTFKNKFFTSFNMGGYVGISNFNVMLKNKYEIKGCWGYVLKIGAITLIEHIEHILISLKFVVTNNICDYTIHDSMKRYHIEELS